MAKSPSSTTIRATRTKCGCQLAQRAATVATLGAAKPFSVMSKQTPIATGLHQGLLAVLRREINMTDQEILQQLVDCYDRFCATSRNQADAYYSLVKGKDRLWREAKDAVLRHSEGAKHD